MIYGYVQVSTVGQCVDTQVKQLRAASAQRVFREKVTGAETNRAVSQSTISRFGA